MPYSRERLYDNFPRIIASPNAEDIRKALAVDGTRMDIGKIIAGIQGRTAALLIAERKWRFTHEGPDGPNAGIDIVGLILARLHTPDGLFDFDGYRWVEGRVCEIEKIGARDPLSTDGVLSNLVESLMKYWRAGEYDVMRGMFNPANTRMTEILTRLGFTVCTLREVKHSMIYQPPKLTTG